MKQSSVKNNDKVKIYMLPSMSDPSVTSPGSYTNWGDVRHICKILINNGLVFGEDFVIVDAKSNVVRDLDYSQTECEWLDYDGKIGCSLKE